MILSMHQKHPNRNKGSGNSLSPVILFSESGGRKKKERKKDRKNTAIPFFSPQFRIIRLRPTSDGSMDVRDL
jgi:hypothetical protein